MKRHFCLLTCFLVLSTERVLSSVSGDDNRPILQGCAVLSEAHAKYESMISHVRALSDIFYRETLPLRPDGKYIETIAASTNIARLAVHIGLQDKSIITIHDEVKIGKKKDKNNVYSKVCYLSGSKSIQLGRRPFDIQDCGFVSFCAVPESKPDMLVVQRTQPNAKALEGRFSRFAKLQGDMFVGGGANFALASEAEKKKSSIESLEIQKTVVVNKVKQEIEEIEKVCRCRRYVP